MLNSNFEPYIKTFNNARVVFGTSVTIKKNNFESIMNNHLTFVDKSMFIKEFIDNPAHISLIIRPHKFGKSTNLSMLNCFFKISHSNEEKNIRRQFFEKLQILAEKKIMQYFAQFPVIYISFKDLTAESWNEMIEKFKIFISKIYGEYCYLINNLYPEEQEEYQQILDKTCNISDLEFALKKLSKYLRQHFKQGCIVLIDEYDSPIECAYNKGYYEDSKDFFQVMFSSLLKGNSNNVTKAMLVGTFPVIESGLGSGLNNIIVYSMHQENRFLDKFGFTSDEVELLLSLCENLQINDIQKWYDGYIAGDSTHCIHLYNPWSIVCLLSDGTLGTYWTDTENTQTLKNYLWKTRPSYKETIKKLLKEGYIAGIEIKNNLQYSNSDQHKNFWTLLYYAGYLTENSEKHLVIPNNEIRSEWHKWIIDAPFFNQGETIPSMLDNLLLGNIKLFSKQFENVVVSAFSYYDVGGSQSETHTENVYHAFCLGMLIVANDRGYIVDFNQEYGMRRCDLKIVPKSGVGEMAIIIKIVPDDDDKSLSDMAQKGLTQIKEKQYRVDLPEEAKKLLEIGIALKGKNACVLGHRFRRTEEGTWKKEQEQDY
ncbi:hypothetical protein Glove_335g63 [Diversispora epigaea]|uniref:AAA-ATPase-like domain-containing protein n=1 Tax=Diversispora epigaea TaxID=1348612 RepID=A0A397HQL1_9GLOM|nr:hypothetical protein Glove_335g63 [Diversispora epigaea]